MNTDNELNKSNSDDIKKKRGKITSFDELKLKSIIDNTIEMHWNIPNKSNPSIWKSFGTKIANLKNNIKYNALNMNTYFYLEDNKNIQIFDKVFETDNENIKAFTSEAYYTIYMTYRNGFTGVASRKRKKYSSDCGWGCMLRSAQSILSRGIYMIKERNNLSDLDRINVINETILLFLDNRLGFDEIKENEDFKNIIMNIDVGINIDEIKTIVPPFSIQNICKFAEFYGKDAGEWFSDNTMIKIFQAINCELDPLGIEIFHFSEGVIYQKELIECCFKDGEKEDEFTFDEKYYKFHKKGIIFISLRAGLDKVEKEYHNAISELLNIPFNIGIIGGRTNFAHYFIGKCKDKLIYLDPHLNQKTISSYFSLVSDNTSYLSKDLYQLDIQNMSPGFTIGFYFRNLIEYCDLTSALNFYSKMQNALFKFLNHPKPQIEYNNINECDDFEII
jgi:cysteine protease ATG4